MHGKEKVWTLRLPKGKIKLGELWKRRQLIAKQAPNCVCDFTCISMAVTRTRLKSIFRLPDFIKILITGERVT